MFCPKCGKENLDASHFCVECGAKLNNNENVQEPKSNNTYDSSLAQKPKISGLAIASLVVSLAGIFVFAIPCGVVSTIFAGISLKNIDKNNQKGKGFAIAGLVVGIVDVVFGIIYLISLLSLKATLS